MDLVEAINAWIDDRIDDLSDEELEQILEILDAVSASDFADLETTLVYNADIFELVDLAGGDANQRAHTEDVLRSAFFQDPLPADEFPGEPLLPTPNAPEDVELDNLEPEDVPAEEVAVEEVAVEELVVIEGSSALVEDRPEPALPDEPEPVELPELSDEPEPEPEPQPTLAASGDDSIRIDLGADQDLDHHLDFALDLDELDVVEAVGLNHESGFLADVANSAAADEKWHNDFLKDVGRVGNVTPSGDRPNQPKPVALREGDALGPSFLDANPEPASKPAGAWKQWTFVVFLLAGLAVFGYGSMQLFDSLSGAEDGIEAAAPTAAEPETPTAAPSPGATTEDGADQAEAGQTVDPSAPTPTPTPPPVPPARIGIRLVTGDVMLASFEDADSPADLKLMYNVQNDGLTPATNLVWLDDMFGVVDADGNVLLLNPDTPSAEPTLIYESDEDLSEAVEVASSNQGLIVRTSDGNVTLVPSDGPADADTVDVLWDAAEEEAQAVDIAATGDLVPFVLDDGTVRVIDLADDNNIDDIWDDEDLPQAFNVGTSETALLLGVGQGSLHRYPFDSDARDPFETIWDSAEDDDGVPAIAYSPVDAGTAVVLGSGALLLVDDTGKANTLWDPAETEIRAFAVAGGADRIAVILESGSVIRIPLSDDEAIASVWDLTDVTLSVANQVAFEKPVSE